MKTKLVSLNAGIRMTIRRGKKEETLGFTCVLPSKAFSQPIDVLRAMCDFVNKEFETNFYVECWTDANISIVKPKRISRPVVDTERIIKELVT